MAQIEDLNLKNPGAAITYQDFVKVARLQAQCTGAGLQGREPTANRALRY